MNKRPNPSLKSYEPKVVWLTGLSGAGKTTLAEALDQLLCERGYSSHVLDGDELRTGLCSDLGFSAADRRENIRRIGEVAKLFFNAGYIVICAFVSPIRKDRDRVRSLVGSEHFVEVFVDTPISICRKRDPKGLYAKADAGLIEDFTGVSSPYEAPLSPEVHMLPDDRTVRERAEALFEYLSLHRRL